jgi:hypothetical protein
VSGLPDCDKSPVWTALQKKPEDRFPSCLDFVRALLEADYVEPDAPPAPRPPRSNAGASTVVPLRQTRIEHTPGPGELTGRFPRSNSNPGTGPPRSNPGELTKNLTLKTIPRLVTPNGQLPGLVTVGSRTGEKPPPQAVQVAYRAQDEELPVAESDGAGAVRINPIRSVVSIAQLLGNDVPGAVVSAGDFITGVLETVAAGGHIPQLPGDLGRLADGTWVCQFPSTIPAQVLGLKVGVLRDNWGLTMDQQSPTQVSLRKAAPTGMWGAISGKKGGLEIVVQLPKASRTVGEVSVQGRLYGTPDKEFIRTAQELLPRLITDARREIGNVEDRRRAPRVACHLPLTVYPLHSDGTVDAAIPGTCRDVSAGGTCFTTGTAMGTKYAYLDFGGITATAGLAILVRVIRSQAPLHPGQPHIYGTQYRTDL